MSPINTIPLYAPIGGMALDFNGVGSFVDCGSGADLDPRSDPDNAVFPYFTIEAWVWPRVGDAGPVISRGTPEELSYRLQIRNGKYNFEWESQQRHSIAISSPSAQPLAWTHIAVSIGPHEESESPKKRLDMKFYVNGKQARAWNTRAKPRSTPDAHVFLGKAVDTETPGEPEATFWNGALRALRYWHGTLSEEQIQWSMETDLAGKTALRSQEGEPPIQLMADWRCSAGYGDFTFDATNQGHNGSLGGGDPAQAPRWIVSTLNRPPALLSPSPSTLRPPTSTALPTRISPSEGPAP